MSIGHHWPQSYYLIFLVHDNTKFLLYINLLISCLPSNILLSGGVGGGSTLLPINYYISTIASHRDYLCGERLGSDNRFLACFPNNFIKINLKPGQKLLLTSTADNWELLGRDALWIIMTVSRRIYSCCYTISHAFISAWASYDLQWISHLIHSAVHLLAFT